MSERVWTEVKIPEAEIFWVESYHIAVDAMLGLPIWKGSEAAKAALARGIIREISIERAEELNQAFAQRPSNAEYLEDQLNGRWLVIARQTDKAFAI